MNNQTGDGEITALNLARRLLHLAKHLDVKGDTRGQSRSFNPLYTLVVTANPSYCDYCRLEEPDDA